MRPENKLDEVKKYLQSLYRNNISSESAISRLADHDITMIQAVKLMMDVYEISLHDVKMLISESPAWQSENQERDKMIDKLEEYLRDNPEPDIEFKEQ